MLPTAPAVASQPFTPSPANQPLAFGSRLVRHDSRELVNGTTDLLFFPRVVGDPSPLVANYGATPFGDSNNFVRIEEIFFGLNVGILGITGAGSAAAVTAFLAKVVNNFKTATVELGVGDQCSDKAQLLRYYMGEMEPQYISAAEGIVVFRDRGFVKLPEPLVIPGGSAPNIKVTFRTTDGLPASGGAVGVPGGKLYLQCGINATAYSAQQRDVYLKQLAQQGSTGAKPPVAIGPAVPTATLDVN